jgi:Dockerin type I domain
METVKRTRQKSSLLFRKCRQPVIEAIEPRLMLSAAPLPVYSPVADPHFIHPTHKAATKTTHASFPGVSSPLGLTPTQVRDAYGLNSINFTGIAGDGTGQTIAIIDAYNDPNAAGDLNAFSATFDLPTFGTSANSPTFSQLGVNDGTDTTQATLPGTDPDGPYITTGGSDWEQEESLDIEWAHVIAPMANITLVETTDSTDLDNGVLAARKLAGVDVVSMSWSGNESSSETTEDADFTTPASHIGITFLAATGDSGSYSSTRTTRITPQYPVSSPNVVAVGGTTLNVNGDTYTSETAWGNGTSSGTKGGSGGGISKFESQPTYQKGIVTQSTTQRTYPDVSMEADPDTGVPIYDSWDFSSKTSNTPWVPGFEGGTSLATPMWAGLIAIADQGRNLAGQTSLDGPTQTLPALYKLSSNDFHDITSGSNGAYSAGIGYDLVTGLGSPVANNLVPDLAGQPQTAIDNLYVKKDASGTQLDEWINSATPGAGTPTQKVPLADASSILFNGAAGNNTLTIDDSADTLSLGGAFNASSTGVINFVGTSAADGLTLTATGFTPSGGFGTTPITLSNVQTVNFPGGSGGSDSIDVAGSPIGGYSINADTPSGNPNIAVTVDGPSAAVHFITTQHLASLTIGSTDTVTLTQSASSGDNLLVLNSLTVANGGTLNLTNNDMIVHNGDLAALTALLATGYDSAQWTGGGIDSSSAANDASKLTALGILLNNANGFTYYTSFDDQAVTNTDILIKFTVYGDANLDGKVNGDDYSAIDNGFNEQLTGWQNGDFNYDGSINGTDYTLIDNAFNEVQVLV